MEAAMPREALQGKFRVFILLSLFTLLMEVAGGILTNSFALLSDAGHVFTDLGALLLVYASMQISKRKPTKSFTFGYYRAEMMAAMANGIVLIFVTAYIFYQSYTRLISPQPVMGREMLAISVVGFLANLYVLKSMKGHEKGNLNVRGAYLHVLSDSLSSVGVIFAGVMIVLTGNYIFDPVMSVAIGLFILVDSIRLVRESARVLMEAAPAGIDLERLARDIERVRGVKRVHDLHVWSVSSDVHSLSSHILIDRKDMKSAGRIIGRVNRMLGSKYNISHTAIQPECWNCVHGRGPKGYASR